MTTRLPPGPPGPPLRDAWQLQADSLLVQRLHHHLDAWRRTVAAGTPPPGVVGTGLASLTRRPTAPVPAEAVRLLRAAHLSHWWQLPRQYGQPAATADSDALADSAAAAARALFGGAAAPGAPWQHAVAAAAEAGAWWVGFFAVIRHRGVHHRSREPHLAPVHREALLHAVRTVAHGVSTRVLRAQMSASDEPTARAAYCRAVTAGLAAERELPLLIEELGETRLADLVSTAVPWRGQFAPYASGSGTGRVE
ncbi:hypothetical protein GCM10027168_11120 [Streptomyces capparidis]